MRSNKDDKRIGLVGGSIERRLANSRVPPIDCGHILAPFRVEADRQSFTEFTTQAPLEVEVGFGRAHHLLGLASQAPEAHVLGFETRREWCRLAARRAERQGYDNTRIVEGDARPFLEQLVGDDAVRRVHVLFPDPWWKRRHHKRRVFSAPWLTLIWRILEPGGALIAKTDVPAYADLMERSVGKSQGFRLAGTHTLDPMLSALPRSHREKKCAENQIPVYAFHYVKEPA